MDSWTKTRGPVGILQLSQMCTMNISSPVGKTSQSTV